MTAIEKMSSLDKMYLALCALFSALLITCTLTYKKIVYLPLFSFHTFTLSVAVIITPLMFILSDLIAEFYGKQKAGFCVKIAIANNIIVALIVTGMNALEATSWSTVNNAIFHQVFGSYGLAFTACLLSVYTAQLVDIALYLWIKKLTRGKWLWLRNNGSTALSLWVDTFVAITLLTLLGIYPEDKMWNVMAHTYSYKLLFSVCSIPFFYLAVWFIRRFILPSSLETETGPRLNLNMTQ